MADPVFVSQAHDFAASNAVTVSHALGTASGNNRCVVVAVDCYKTTTAPVISGVTYNGTAMTAFGSGTVFASEFRVQFFTIVDASLPASAGSYDVVATTPDGEEVAVTVTEWTTVNQSTPLTSEVTATGTDDGPTVTVTTTSGDTVIACCGGYVLDYNVAEQTERSVEEDGDYNTDCYQQSHIATGASTVMSWDAGFGDVWGVVGAVLAGYTAAASAALTGTATDTIDEADVVTGGPTIILTLTGDTYIAAGTGPIGTTANSEALIDGIDSAQNEAGGWDAKVKAAIKAALATYLVRTSDTVATVTIPPTADYDITAQETITATIPAAVLTGDTPIVASPTFTVDTVAASPSLVSRHHPRGIMRGTMRGSS